MCDDNENTQTNETNFKYHIIDDREEKIVVHYTLVRGEWRNRSDFILACIGTTVGFGQLLRFPYLCFKNGGGAFLIPYIIILCFIGIPLFFLELALGQFSSLGAIGIWDIFPMFKGVGYGMIFISGFISIYYNIIIGQCIYYFGVSFTKVLPWASCNNSWNNRSICYNCTGNSSILEHGICASEEYYDNLVLNKSTRIEDMGFPQWRILICFAVAWVIVIPMLLKAAKYMENVSYLTASLSYLTALSPYGILTIFLIPGLSLSGSKKGILYYVNPDFEHLKNPVVWVEAATQIFFSLSLCNGNLITMSRYNKFKNNCLRDAVLVAIINCGISVYGGFVFFSYMGFMAHIKNVNMSEVVEGGLGLAFKIYPHALTQMNNTHGSIILSALFFRMMIFMGVGSQIALVETVLSSFQDELTEKKVCTSEKGKMILRISICVILFVIGIPMTCRGGMYLLEIFDEAVNGFPRLVLALVELLVVSYCYGIERFLEDIKQMIGYKPNYFWKYCWIVISPVSIFVLIIALVVYSIKTPPKLSPGFVALKTIISIIPILLSVVFFIVFYCKKGRWVQFAELRKPPETWGPDNEDHKNDFHESITLNKADASKNDFFQSKESITSKSANIADKKIKEEDLQSQSLLNKCAQQSLNVIAQT